MENAELAARIEQLGVAFRDDDPARSQARAHHIWWNSGLPRSRFLALVETAQERTVAQVSRGKVRSGTAGQRKSMGYFFAILEELARDEADLVRGAG